MAEAFVSFLLENLSSLIQGEIGLILGVDKEMNKLSSSLTTIQAVLEDAEEKQFESKAVNNWLCKINDLTYEIDDILDECTAHVSQLKHLKNKSSHYLKNVLYRRNVGRRIKEVTKRMTVIAAERAQFHLREITIDTQRNFAPSRETCSIVNESHLIYGRDEEKEKIVDILLNQFNDRHELSILPIIGIGGLGKTTLAQLVFNDGRVVEHFEIKLWVSVSNDFDYKTLLKAILESASRNGSASNLMRLDTLQRQVWELLSSKRYLLVLDDVWNHDQENWSMLKSFLACGSSGTSIIVTTRLKIVADIMSTFPAHHLRGLSEEDCWFLLKQRAFGQEEEEEEEHSNLEAIGKLIAKKCVGVPLAAKALGGLLRFKKTTKEWIHVKESEIWNLPQTENSILPALRLSYNHLPLIMRQCFAYCAVFPKDFEIEKEELILRWVAHGYISSTGTLEAEDLGHEIWNELVLRCLFHNVRKRYDGQIMFSIHDLVHDLAQSIMENKVLGTQLRINNSSASNIKIREVNLRNNTIVFPTSILLNMDLTSVLTNFSRLRMLNASKRSINNLPSLIGKMIHMRYLNFSYTKVRSLPDTICNLWNLKILKLNYCEELVVLPKNMRFMRNLRHLFLDNCTSLREMPPNIGELTSLKTLSLFIVDHKKSNELQDLQYLDLGGRLYIDHLERVKTHLDASKSNLSEKHNIDHLGLIWKGENVSNVEEKVFEALRPPQNLRTLFISGFPGTDFPMWMSDSTLENIVEITIMKCPNCPRLPRLLGELPHLKKLILEELIVQYVIEDEGPQVSSMTPKFKRLERLDLLRLPNLRSLLKENVEEMFPNLQILKVTGSSSLVLPKLLSLKQLHLFNCSNATVTSFALAKLDTVTILSLGMNENMTYIPKEALEKLTNLKVLLLTKLHDHCLPKDGLGCLNSLKTLVFLANQALTYLPREWMVQLTALEALVIEDCPELTEFPEEIIYLKNLKSLSLSGLPKMTFESIQVLSSLQYLHLQNLPRLFLPLNWLGRLTSLDHLLIYNCQNLASIPAVIKEMKNMTSLTIGNCPKLERRCVKDGEDWQKIAHIANLRFENY